jgi:glucan 1,3-beta-glucosidase
LELKVSQLTPKKESLFISILGDGITDDTAAIQLAISSGGRCRPGSACKSTTITPAIVYFPAGTYLISSSIIDYYFTQIIGNPNSLPVLKASPTFSGFGLIDGDQYQAGGVLGFGATNIFFRQVRNLIFDMRGILGSSAATGIHWPTAQATSLQNCVFLMSDIAGTQHQGVFIEDGELIIS